MKFIRIFLFVLIIIGGTALATHSWWVPKLVASIISKDPQYSVVVPVQQLMPLTDGRQCYSYSHDATASAPYTVQELLDITIAGTTVTGTKTGTQSGPDMTNGYTGSFVGTQDGERITGIYSYTVEGAKNKEQELYRTALTGLMKLRYPLVEHDGVLVPDTTHPPVPQLYARVPCEGSN